jgi:triacylglycerol lipase
MRPMRPASNPCPAGALLCTAWLAVMPARAAVGQESDLQQPSLIEGECVVLLHGLGRTYRSMERIESALRAAGFTTANVDYPSQSQAIEALARSAVPEGVGRCQRKGAQRIHFVTHSMGGLIIRYYLSSGTVAELGRVVMLGPPNQGSEVADAMVGNALYDRVNGPAGAQLVTGPEGIAARLGPVDFPLGIITGTEQTAFDSLLSSRIPGPNDGKVSVERAKVEGMGDFLMLPVTHTFMVNNDVVIGQVLQFLRYGAFIHEAPAF